MDRDSVFVKTAKGLFEATGKTLALPRDMRALLRELDGLITAGEAQAKHGKYSDDKLLEVLKELATGKFIRELEQSANDAAQPLRPSPPPAAFSGQSSHARARPSLLRQTFELSALVLAYLQYYYIDVQLQILSMPSITA
jgi:hypothetical protein